MKLLFIFLAMLLLKCPVNAQPAFVKAARDAFLITRMINKFHVQPRAVNATLSADVFYKLMQQLDRQHVFFTAEDIAGLAVYKSTLHQEINARQTGFLARLTAIYLNKLQGADTMIDNICKQPFDFLINEKITVAEDTAFPANEAALRSLFRKHIKRAVLYSIIESKSDLAKLGPVPQKKYVDSIEPVMRKRVQSTFKRTIQRKLQSPGGIQQLVGDEYCKAIASCFDPHTNYMPLSEKENFESELGQKQMGFGFSLDEDNDGNVIIEDLKAGSPAYKSGQLNAGDKIEAIEWQGKASMDVTGASKEEIGRILTASNHDQAILKIKKADGSSRSVTLMKEQQEADNASDGKVKSYLLKGAKTIGYISLPAFYNDWENEEANVNGCANDVAKEILKLKKENIEGLVLDVRYNGGGSMQEAIELAGIFIDAGPVGMIKTRDQKVITLKDVNRGTVYDGPLLLLVNGYSASASEMLAGTLQDYNRAVIAGTPTYGKATAQLVLPLDTTINLESDPGKVKSDSYVKITMDQLYRVNGTTAQANGVTPDVLVPDILDAHPEREADDPFVLRSVNIEANRYYKPGVRQEVNSLNDAAKTLIESSTYFKGLLAYIDLEKSLKLKKDESLKLADALLTIKLEIPGLEGLKDEQESTLFKVANHGYELQRLTVDSRLELLNENWKSMVSKDPYIQLAYLLMTKMIK